VDRSVTFVDLYESNGSRGIAQKALGSQKVLKSPKTPKPQIPVNLKPQVLPAIHA